MTGANSSPGIISPGKMRSTLKLLSPLLAVSRGVFVFKIVLVVVLVPVIENGKIEDEDDDKEIYE
jgi:hypothetical protein